MKYWFLGLVLANIIFFLWEIQHKGVQSFTEPAAGRGENQILLLSELANRSKLLDNAPKEETALSSISPNQSDSLNHDRVRPGTSTDNIDTVPDNRYTFVQRRNSDVITLYDQHIQPHPLRNALQGNGEVIDNIFSKIVDNLAADDEKKPITELQYGIETTAEANFPTDFLALHSSAALSRGAETATSDSVTNRMAKPDLEAEDRTTGEIEPQHVSDHEATVASADTEFEPASDYTGIDKPSDETKQETVSEQDPNIESTTASCYEIGPFSRKSRVIEWMGEQQIDKTSVEGFYKRQQVTHTFLIYYPAGATFAESKKNEKMLKRKGVSDLWLFRDGEMKGMISLGLFKDKFNAEKMLKRLSEQGIVAELKDRSKTEEAWYARVGQMISDGVENDLTVTRCSDP